MSRIILVLSLFLAVPGAMATVSFDVAVDRLDDAVGVPVPTNALVLLVADTNGDGLGQAIAGDYSLNALLDGFDGDDLVIFRADLTALGSAGSLAKSTGGLALGGSGLNQWSEGDPLYLVWLPGLTLADLSAPVGVAYGARAVGVTPVDGGNEALVYVAPTPSGIFGTNRIPSTSTNLRSDLTTISLSNPPSIGSPSAGSITSTGATLGGEVLSENGAPVTVRGVVYSAVAANPDPVLGGSGVLSVTSGSGPGTFSQAVTGLSSGVTYAYRAFATNFSGTSYSATARFTTDSTITLLSGVGSASGGIFPGDQHRFHFTVSGARVGNVTTSGVPLRARFYDSTGRLIAEQTIAGSVSLASLPLVSGTYTIELIRDPGEGSAGPYGLSVNAATTALAKPDGAVGTSLTSVVGNNVYAPSVQRITLSASNGQPVTAYVTATNRGNIRDRIVVRGTAGNADFSVAVFDQAGANITAQFVAGTHKTSEMLPSVAPDWVRMVVTPTPRAVQLGRNFIPYIYLNSDFNSAASDRVSVLVNTR